MNRIGNEISEQVFRRPCAGGSRTGRALRRMALLLLLLGMAGTAGAQATYYVFYRGDNYFSTNTDGTSVQNSTSFNYRCIWKLEGSTLQHVSSGKYLNYANGSLSLSTTATTTNWFVNTNGNLTSGNTSWLRRNNSTWSMSDRTNSRATAAEVDFTDMPRLTVQIVRAAGEDGIIATTESSADYSASEARYSNEPYATYTYNGTTIYAYTGNSREEITGEPTFTTYTTSSSEASWSWNSPTTLTLTWAADGVVTLSGSRPASDQRVSITATVTINGITATSAPVELLIHTSSIPFPSIDYETDTLGLVTLLSDVPGGTIYYTTDGSDPRNGNSTRATYTPGTPIDLHTVPAANHPVLVQAVVERNGNYSAVTSRLCYLQLCPPRSSAVRRTEDFTQATLTLTTDHNHNVPDNIEIYYTLDGSDPAYIIDADGTVRVTNGTLYSDPFTIAANREVHTLAVLSSGIALPSPVGRAGYRMNSGLYKDSTVVVLNDYEDHRWSYYSGDPSPCNASDYRTPAELRSLQPCNVRIIYKAGGVGSSTAALSGDTDVNGIDETLITEFQYFETLEKSGTDYTYPYTTIPNPFSKRPKEGSTYYGFNGWKVTDIDGGTVSQNGTPITEGSTINAEQEVIFTLTGTPVVNSTMITIELTAQWAAANVVTTSASNLPTALESSSLSSGSYELNFVVITGGTRTNAISTTSQKPVTISMRYPDGTDAAYSGNLSYLSGGFTCNADTKFEYIHLNGTNATYTANNHDLILGRGISNTTSGDRSINTIQGMSEGTTANLNYTMRIESGVYNDFAVLRYGSANYSGAGTNNVKVILGNDFDRARNDNSKLSTSGTMYVGRSCYFSTVHQDKNILITAKSGQFQTNKYQNNIDQDENESFYLGIYSTSDYGNIGTRKLIIEGGEFCGIAGGVDKVNVATQLSLVIRMKGGIIRGSVYGAGAYAYAMGNRKYVITGGQINGWVAGACNGTSDNSSGGTLDGNTYLYIGGNAIVGKTDGTTQDQINYSTGGNVFGAGSGNTNQPTTGQVNDATVVIADEARIMQNVYAGGNMGYANETGSLYVLGGVIEGSAFGGSNKKQGTNTIVNMHGGTVKGSVYGGSNETGTISENAVVTVTGGRVEGSVFGGGLGEATRIGQDVSVTVGYDSISTIPDPTDPNTTIPNPNRCVRPAGTLYIAGDVYGGSQMGVVNSEADTNTVSHITTNSTHVTLRQGRVGGSVYGGGYGEGRKAAHVAGTVTVTVTGGVADGDVYGCNNMAGKPLGPVYVNIEGGNVNNVYGGGNAAAYGDGPAGGNQQAPHVLMTAGIVRTSVYGGGKGAAAEVNEHSDVRVRDKARVGKNVYGGGNAAPVKGSTHVEIGGK